MTNQEKEPCEWEEIAKDIASEICRKTHRVDKPESGVAFYQRVKLVLETHIQSLLATSRTEADQRVAEAVRGERERVREIINGMKKELPAIKWKDEHEENVIKASYNQALADLSDNIK